MLGDAQHAFGQNQLQTVAFALHRRPERVDALEDLVGGNRWALCRDPFGTLGFPDIQCLQTFSLMREINGDGMPFASLRIP